MIAGMGVNESRGGSRPSGGRPAYVPPHLRNQAPAASSPRNDRYAIEKTDSDRNLPLRCLLTPYPLSDILLNFHVVLILFLISLVPIIQLGCSPSEQQQHPLHWRLGWCL
jgi:hypothetical protein